jgi:ubiquinone/menaquinone biosynthesis C-methylase UbiE
VSLKRVVTAELLDSDQGTSEEVAGSLADLQWLNRHFGGHTTTAALLSRVAERTGLKALTFLDVAGATGDVASAALDRLKRIGLALDVTVIDRSASHLAKHKERNGAAALVGDALQLPFCNGSFDVVGSSLFVHHLEPEQIVRFVNEALRISRHAVIINDLRRDPIHLLTAYAGGAIYRSRITRHDSVASVKRAYTPEELREILSQSDAGEIEITRHFFYRMGVVIWRRSGARR